MKYVIAFYGPNGMGYVKSLDDSTDCIDEAMWFDDKDEAESWISDLKKQWNSNFRIVEVEDERNKKTLVEEEKMKKY